MKCNKIIERYLMLDKHQMIPFDITLHLLFCKKCRLEVVKLVAAEKTAAATLKDVRHAMQIDYFDRDDWMTL